MATVDGILKTWTSGTLVPKNSYMSSYEPHEFVQLRKWSYELKWSYEVIVHIDLYVWIHMYELIYIWTHLWNDKQYRSYIQSLYEFICDRFFLSSCAFEFMYVTASIYILNMYMSSKIWEFIIPNLDSWIRFHK